MKRSFQSATLLLSLFPGLAWSGSINAAPEPGTFELLALGGVMAVVIAVRNRRKK